MRRYKPLYKPRSLKRLERKSRRNLIFSILVGILVLYFLFSWGLPTLIGALSFFNNLKPHSQKEQIAEAIPPPVLNIPFESTSSSTLKISGFSTPSSRVEIYFDDGLATTAETLSDGAFITNAVSLALGTNNIYGQTILDGKKSLSSKVIRLIYSNEKPKINIIEPGDNQEIKGGEKKVKVSGTIEGAATLFVNSSSVQILPDGNFSTEISLNDGENKILVSAASQAGNTSQLERKVMYRQE